MPPPTTVTDIPVLLTSREEMQDIASQRGIDLRLDDNNDGVISTGIAPDFGEESFLDEVIIEASDEALMRLEHYYEDGVLEGSRWVRRRVSYIAVPMLSARRGNPKIYCDEYKKYMDQFDRIANGDPMMQIPRLPKRANFEPALSNQVVDMRFRTRKLRTQRFISPGGEDARQDLDYGHGYFWWY